MATYYIHTSGNDTTGNGSAGNPWLTLSKAITTAADGDTIIVKNSGSTYTLGSYTIGAKSLTITGESHPTLSVLDGAAGGFFFSVATTETLILENLTFQNASCGASGASAGFGGAADSVITVRNCILKSMNVGGFSGNAQGGLFGRRNVTATNMLITVERCLFYELVKSGSGGQEIFRIDDASCVNSDIVFTNNTFYSTQTTNQLVGIMSAALPAGASGNFRNNIFYNGGSSLAALAATISQSYNDWYGTWSGTISGTGNITSDPLFVDVASQNFNLRPTSPCLNTGTLI